MKPVVRHGLFIVFTGAFFVVAPVLLFFASGYRYNVAKGKIEQTGQLLVTSKPAGAEVRVDGDAHSGSFWRKIFALPPSRTPLRVQNILSGSYKVDLTRAGYLPWTRTVSVSAQQTSFVTEIVLFPQEAPHVATASEVRYLGSVTQEKVVSSDATVGSDNGVVRDATLDTVSVRNTVWYLTRTTEGVALEYIARDQTGTPRRVTVFPEREAHFVVSAQDRYLEVVTPTRMYVVELRSSSYYVTPIEHGAQIVWLKDDEALVRTDFEIWRYVFKGAEHEQHLITRQSVLIAGIAGYKEFPYVLFVREGKELVAMELFPDSPNTYTIATGEIGALAVSQNGKHALFEGVLDGKDGVFSLPLMR